MILKVFDPKGPPEIKKLLIILNRIIVIIFILFLILILSNKLFLKYSSNFILQKINSHVFGIPEVSISNLDDMGRYIKGFVKGHLSDSHEYASIDMKLSQKNILMTVSPNENGENVYVKADFTFNDNVLNKELEGKIRSKGDRALHRESLTQYSYRINLKGDDRILGLEEFSIQRPIIRGYTWELLLASIMKEQGLLTLKSTPINFSVNGDNRGLYILEEVPSIRTVETQYRKAGPIFGLNENITTHIEVDTELDVYDEKEWIGKPLYDQAKAILEEQFLIAANEGAFNEEYFDFDEWSKYFALNDLFGTLHGTTPKSVKFYFNPVIGKFQPILYDAHKGAGSFPNFILSDLIFDRNVRDAGWIVPDSSFYLAFFQNSTFYNSYMKYLIEYSSETFIYKIHEIYKDSFEQLDNYFYSKLSRSDGIFYPGNNLYIFKFSEIEERAHLLSEKIKVLNQKIKYFNFTDKVSERKESDLNVDNNINILNMSDFHFKGTELTYREPTIIRLSGENSIEGLSKESPLLINGPVMIVQEEGSLVLSNIIIKNPVNIPVQNRNWSGAINIISSNVMIDDLTIIGNNSEDAINFVNSHFTIKKIHIESALSDAIDFDYSAGTISSVSCVDIGNDAIDGSESNVIIDYLIAENVLDKGVSAGENSIININTAILNNVGIGLVSKDGSSLDVIILEISKVKLPVSAFTKKPEYDSPSLVVHDVLGIKNDFAAIVSPESFIQLPIAFDVERVSSSDIEDLMYGEVYGIKTIK